MTNFGSIARLGAPDAAQRDAVCFMRDERGSFSLILAISLPIALLLTSLVVDYGNVYGARRNLQTAVDLAALEAVRALPDRGAAELAATQVLRANLPPDVPISATFEFGVFSEQENGTYVYPIERRFVPNDSVSGAIRIEAQRDLPGLLSSLAGIDSFSLAATAVAISEEENITLRLASTLANVNTDDSRILNAIMGSLLPESSINLDVLGWQGVVQSQLRMLTLLEGLASEIGISILDTDRLLSSDVTLSTFFNMMAEALVRDVDSLGNQPQGVTALRLLSQQAAGLPPFRLGDLLQLSSGSLSALDVQSHVLRGYDIVNAAAQLVSQENGVSADIGLSLGLASVSLRAQVMEPPSILMRGPAGSAVEGAQTRVRLNIQTALNTTGIPLIGNLLELNLPLYIALGGGRLTADVLGCDVRRADRYVDITAATDPLNLQIGQMTDAAVFGGGPVAAAPIPIARVRLTVPNILPSLPPLLDAEVAEITLLANSSQAGESMQRRVLGPFDPAVTQSIALNRPAAALTDGLLGNMTLAVRLLPSASGLSGLLMGAVNDLVNTIIATVLPPLSGLVSDALAPILDALLMPTFNALGVEAGVVDGSLESLQCGETRLVI